MERWSRELGLESWIHFLGRLDGPEKYRLLSSARALLMPSRFETFGMVAIEALAAGAPVVAFDVGPLAEVAGPGGAYLVPPFDCKAFADIAMGLVQDQASAEQRRRQGQAWARRYDWGAITACQEMVYLKRAEGGGRRW
jgi:glycosyltransferase involved in cell wall biosynthesis